LRAQHGDDPAIWLPLLTAQTTASQNARRGGRS
jgi:hypothetical protein